MIKIIKSGNEEKLKMLKETKIFDCDFCDCIFEATRGDYTIALCNPEVMRYSCKCPACGMVSFVRCKIRYD